MYNNKMFNVLNTLRNILRSILQDYTTGVKYGYIRILVETQIVKQRLFSPKAKITVVPNNLVWPFDD